MYFVGIGSTNQSYKPSFNHVVSYMHNLRILSFRCEFGRRLPALFILGVTHIIFQNKKPIPPSVHNQLADYPTLSQNLKHVSKSYKRTPTRSRIIKRESQSVEKSDESGHGYPTSFIKEIVTSLRMTGVTIDQR